MKALSLLQPWASLVACGYKHWESRRYPEDHLGPLAIHASLGYPGGKKKAREMCERYPFKRLLDEMDVTLDGLPRGCIVAVCEMVDCLPALEARVKMAGRGQDELHLGWYVAGRWAYEFQHVVKVDPPIPAKGAMSLWKVEADAARTLKALLFAEKNKQDALFE